MLFKKLNDMEKAAVDTLKKYEVQIKFAKGKSGWQYHNQEKDQSLVIQNITSPEHSDEIEQALDTLIIGMYNRSSRSYKHDSMASTLVSHQGMSFGREPYVNHILVSNRNTLDRVYLDMDKPTETFHIAEELAKVMANNGVNFPGSSQFLEPAKSA